MSAPARTAAVGEAMTVLRADAPAASWLTADDFIPGQGPGERTNEA
jgi:hypothetical protein